MKWVDAHKGRGVPRCPWRLGQLVRQIDGAVRRSLRPDLLRRRYLDSIVVRTVPMRSPSRGIVCRVSGVGFLAWARALEDTIGDLEQQKIDPPVLVIEMRYERLRQRQLDIAYAAIPAIYQALCYEGAPNAWSPVVREIVGSVAADEALPLWRPAKRRPKGPAERAAHARSMAQQWLRKAAAAERRAAKWRRRAVAIERAARRFVPAAAEEAS